MPCLMRGSLTMSSRMEVPAEGRTGAREAGCAVMARSEAVAWCVLRIGPNLEILCAPKDGKFRDLLQIGIAGLSRQFLLRDHGPYPSIQRG